MRAQGPGGGGVVVRGWVGGGWAQATCLPWVQNQGAPQWGSLTEGPSVPSPTLPAPAPCALGYSSAAQPCPNFPPGPIDSLWGWGWRPRRELPSFLPAPHLLSLSSHIELAISVSATHSGPRQGRGWRDRVSLSRWCMSVSSFLSVCYPCPVLLLAPSFTLREAPVGGDRRISLGSHGGY